MVMGNIFNLPSLLLLMEKTAHIFVSGRVQGIGFRFFVSSVAKRRGLKGYVRNLNDGRVEILFQGDEGVIKEALEVIKTGHPLARIDKLEVSWKESKEKFDDFQITY